MEQLDPAAIGKPEDLAAAIAFLASDDAAFITGTAPNVDGGRLARLRPCPELWFRYHRRHLFGVDWNDSFGKAA